MPRASASVRVAEHTAGDLVSDYVAHLARTGRGTTNAEANARRFLRRWPEPQQWADQPLRPASLRGPEHEVLCHLLDRLGPHPPRLRLPRLAKARELLERDTPALPSKRT